MANMTKLAVVVVMLITAAATTLLGTAILGGMSKTVRDSTVVELTEFNVSVVGTPASLAAYEFPQSLTGCTNASDATDTLTSGTDYTITEGFDEDDGLFNLVNGGYNNSLINCSTLTYLEDSGSSDAADLFAAALIVFGTFMAIISLSVVGKHILEIFREKD